MHHAHRHAEYSIALGTDAGQRIVQAMADARVLHETAGKAPDQVYAYQNYWLSLAKTRRPWHPMQRSGCHRQPKSPLDVK